MGICQSYIESIPFGSDVINKIMIKYKMKFNGCYDALKHEEYDGRDMVHLIPLVFCLLQELIVMTRNIGVALCID